MLVGLKLKSHPTQKHTGHYLGQDQHETRKNDFCFKAKSQFSPFNRHLQFPD